jgi:putative oxidoreductase
MAKLTLGSRYILGLIYFVFGLNGFLNFIPMPPLPEVVNNFFTGLMATGYFLPFLKATEVICGILLLSGFFVPLALVVLAPITIQIFLFHAILTPGVDNIILPVLMIALHVLAATHYKNIYKPILKMK